MMEIVLPWPPSVNHYKRIGRTIATKNGKMYQQRVNTNETKKFYYDVWLIIKSWSVVNRKNLPLESTISLSVHLHVPDKRKRDIDGPIKVLLDSLQRGGLIKDDYQISRLLIERMDIIDQGKVVVKIEEAA
jgi:crossover junction endodeoxyribonuclease RusA